MILLKRINILLVLLLLTLGALGQSVTRKAAAHYQEGELEKARHLIDSAITLDAEKEQAYTWHIRGFIYKELLKQAQGDKRYAYLDSSIVSFKKCLNKGAEGDVKKNSKNALNFFANRYFYNQAMKLLDTSNYERPIELFNRYIDLSKDIGRTDKELRNDRIGFYNNLGVVYMNLHEGKKEHDEALFNKAIEAFGKVLAIDSSNYLANYNTARMHYNRGVQIAQQLDPSRVDVNIAMVQKKQKQSTKHFKKALPYMKTAHEQRPKRLETLEGLSGIYYSLNDDERSKHYKQMKQKIIEERNN